MKTITAAYTKFPTVPHLARHQATSRWVACERPCAGVRLSRSGSAKRSRDVAATRERRERNARRSRSNTSDIHCLAFGPVPLPIA